MNEPQPPLTPQQEALRRQVRRDMLVDLAGNLALALGLWGWFSDRNVWDSPLHHAYVFIPLTATGILNLLHLPARLRRLKEWQQQRP